MHFHALVAVHLAAGRMGNKAYRQSRLRQLTEFSLGVKVEWATQLGPKTVTSERVDKMKFGIQHRYRQFDATGGAFKPVKHLVDKKRKPRMNHQVKVGLRLHPAPGDQ